MNNSVLKILTLSIVIIATMSCREKAASVKDGGSKDSIVASPAVPIKEDDFGCLDKYSDSICKVMLVDNRIGKRNKFVNASDGYIDELTYLGIIKIKADTLKLVYNIGCWDDNTHKSSGLVLYDMNNQLVGNYGFGMEVCKVTLSKGKVNIKSPNCINDYIDTITDSIPAILGLADTLNGDDCESHFFCPSSRKDISRYGNFKKR